ncbi:MAG: PD40 domain-containing protein [Caldilineaceae bacterium]|nr:PD40 domain-containing protein [Caldilineaceae bacterium]
MNCSKIMGARFLQLLALTVVFLLLVSACGGDEEETPTPTAAPTAAPTATATVVAESPMTTSPLSAPDSPMPTPESQSDAAPATLDAAVLTFLTDKFMAPADALATWQALLTTGKLLFLEMDDGSQTFLVDSAAVTPLFSDFDVAVEAIWSPTGEQIAFAAKSEENKEELYKIYLANADGSNVHLLLEDQPGYNFRPVWSPAGDFVLFVSNRDGNQEIYRVNVDGTGLVNLTNNDANDSAPSLSPDGNTIAFVSDRPGYPALHFMNADGSNVLQMLGEEWRGIWPRWSPDGSKLVFASDHEGFSTLYLLGKDGSAPQRITTDSGDHIEPYWVDNERLIFVTGYGVSWDLYLINIDGSNLVQLTNTHEISERYPVWFSMIN